MAVANSNGRALKPEVFEAKTELFKSDINEANYHSVTFRNLQPDTLYTYRVGDGVNWTEYTTSERQAIEQDRLALFILVTHKMKFEPIGRVYFVKHFGMRQELHLPFMRATS